MKDTRKLQHLYRPALRHQTKKFIWVLLISVACIFSTALNIGHAQFNIQATGSSLDYGPGFPDYCSAYPNYPECIAYANNQIVPMPADVCFGAYDINNVCIPTPNVPCGREQPHTTPYAQPCVPAELPANAAYPIPTTDYCFYSYEVWAASPECRAHYPQTPFNNSLSAVPATSATAINSVTGYNQNNSISSNSVSSSSTNSTVSNSSSSSSNSVSSNTSSNTTTVSNYPYNPNPANQYPSSSDPTNLYTNSNTVSTNSVNSNTVNSNTNTVNIYNPILPIQNPVTIISPPTVTPTPVNLGNYPVIVNPNTSSSSNSNSYISNTADSYATNTNNVSSSSANSNPTSTYPVNTYPTIAPTVSAYPVLVNSNTSTSSHTVDSNSLSPSSSSSNSITNNPTNNTNYTNTINTVNAVNSVSNNTSSSLSMYQLPYTPHSASCLDNAVPCSTIVATKVFDSNNTLATPVYTVGEKFFYHVSSPYTGYLYVFLTEPNGQTKLLYPNMYTPVSMYINAGTGVTLPSNTATYHLTIAPPLGEHTIFYYVLTQFVEADTFNAVTRKQDVDKIVENLGLTKNIYHGYGEGKFHAYER